ncbi:MAG TPA: hypothetical protein VEL75_14835, partial [Candidatus Methylomirabilis sp.]|nr:hypothetical protein [Candidatus Methylomirabilis sp.]
LPDKGAGSTPITVTSSTGCGSVGTRLNPATQYGSLYTITGHGPAALIVKGHHWTVQCAEITNDTTPANRSAMLIYLGTDAASTCAGHDIMFQRNFVHNPEVQYNNLTPLTPIINATRGIDISSCMVPANITVQDSWIGSFGNSAAADQSSDTYGILVGGAVDTWTIKNNYIAAFFNNVFIVGEAPDPAKMATISNPTNGGATLSNSTGVHVGSIMSVQVPTTTNGCNVNPNNPKCYQAVKVTAVNPATGAVTWTPYGAGGLNAGLVPIDGGTAAWDGKNIQNGTVTLNYMWKDPRWQQQWTGGAKDYIEIKSCVNCSYTANTFQGACAAVIAYEVAQGCSNGLCPWTTVANNTFQDNLMLGDVSGVFVPLGGAQATGTFMVSATPGANIVNKNNLWTNVVASCGTNPGVSAVVLSGGPGDTVLFQHNTWLNASSIDAVFAGSTGLANFTFKDNVLNYGRDGFNWNNPGGVAGAWPPNGIVESKNVMVIDGQLTNSPTQAGESPNSFHPATWSAVGFVNLANCQGQVDYNGCALSAGSRYHNAGSDGTDPGVNMTTLNSALGLGPGGPARATP